MTTADYLNKINTIAIRLRAKGDGRLIAIIDRGTLALKAEFPKTYEQAGKGQKTPRADFDRLLEKKIGPRVQRFLVANKIDLRTV
jgi:hypothetical protein